MKTLTVVMAAVLMMSTALSSVIRVPTEVLTIQAAILSTNDGDTIRVYSGTYLGPINVTKSLVLIGSGDTAMTAIVAPPDFGTNPGYIHFLPHFTPERTIVYIGASPAIKVLMTGFTVDGLRLGPGLSDCTAYSGILAERCNVTLTNNTVRNILPADSNGSTWDPQKIYNGRGIEVRGDSSNATISDNYLEEVNHFNIFVNATDDNNFPASCSPVAYVSGNTIVGKGAYRGGQKGIWFNAGAWGTVTGNVITGLDYPDPAQEPERASGIVVRYGYLDALHSVTITNNRVIAASAMNSKGIYVEGSHTVVTGNYVSGFRWNIESHDGISIVIAANNIIGGHIGVIVSSEKTPPYADTVTIGGDPGCRNVIKDQDSSAIGGFAISFSFRNQLYRGDDYASTVPVDATHNDFGVYTAEGIRARLFVRGDTTLLPHDIDTVFYSPFYTLLEDVRSGNSIAEEFRLEQNYPNPFNPTTVISCQVPGVSDVRLVVYDILGREVAVLLNERKMPGRYDVTFNASGLASGLYVYRLQASNVVQTKKMIVLR